MLWSYNLETILPLCKEFEEKLIKHIWRTRGVSHRTAPSVSSTTGARPVTANSTTTSIAVISPDGSQTALNEKAEASVSVTSVPAEEGEGQSKEAAAAVAETAAADKEKPTKRSWWSWKLQPRPAAAPAANAASASSDPEQGGKRKERKLVLIGPIYAGLGAAMSACACLFPFFFPSVLVGVNVRLVTPLWTPMLILCFVSPFPFSISVFALSVVLIVKCADFMTAGCAVLLEEFRLDGDATRFALIATLPVIFCVSLVRRLSPFLSYSRSCKLTRVGFCLHFTVLLPPAHREHLSHVRIHSSIFSDQ